MTGFEGLAEKARKTRPFWIGWQVEDLKGLSSLGCVAIHFGRVLFKIAAKALP